MNKIKNYTILFSFITIAILLFYSQCNSIKDNKTIVESIKTIEKWDTINRPYEVVKFQTIYKPKYDTIRDINPGEINQDSLFYYRTYNDSLTDSNITIFTSNKVYGVLDGTQVNYRLKVPKYIEHNKEIIKTNTVTQQPKLSIYSGVSIDGNDSKFNISPFIDLNIKKVNVGINYGLIDKTIGFKIGYRLFKSRK